MLTALIALVVGLINCFAGFRFFRLVLALWGFLAGVALVNGLLGGVADGTGLLLVGLGGLVGAGVSFALYAVGVVIFGATFGFLLGATLANSAGLEGGMAFIIGGLGAILLGLLALRAARFIVILTSAFGGAWAVVGGALVLTGTDPATPFLINPGVPTNERELLAVGAWLVLGLVGMMVQYAARD